MAEAQTELTIDGGILVGHDGSPASSQAVVWAARHAARLGDPLHVLRAWKMTNAPRPASLHPGYVPPLSEFEDAVLHQLSRQIEGLGLPTACDVRLHAVHGQSADKLIEAAARAELVVVGARGAGGFRGLLLGSTADQVMRHAPCPVVVVPGGRD
ncbi:MAG: Universal stress protein family [uncultured Nocardioides sp.]|uniref:Universal stress protein family n=1 Tax=uncultured Nocardioides sp. TaxID=198441 RepID=A0A6J4MXS4_9ACTN|nr:MAG: Universal stress protein family [uncultured Nocardioides sp.]